MTIAFLGAGKMASALIHGLIRAGGCAPGDITAASPDPSHLQTLRDSAGINVTESNADAARAADTVILCVKPKEAASALAQASGALDGKLLISIAAGLRISSLQQHAPASRIVRAMPNTPALVGKSATAYAAAPEATADDRALAERIFSSIGEAHFVEENLIDAVTAVSGSGPAYIFLVIEAMTEGGVRCGLPAELARRLAIQTVVGAGELCLQTGDDPAHLREMVTSPGGTTAAALATMENLGVRTAFIDAIRGAKTRAKELSGQ
jgi:pyrroline-5-carboxylate reductase